MDSGAATCARARPERRHVASFPYEEGKVEACCVVCTRQVCQRLRFALQKGSRKAEGSVNSCICCRARRTQDFNLRATQLARSRVHRSARGKETRYLKKQETSPKYQKMMAKRMKLPAYRKKEIIDVIQSNAVTVIAGATGSGKSTQVPAYILEDCVGNAVACNIVCTQPRRIAAIGVAERVAAERAESIGGTVGYSIRLESKTSARTRLTFVTTGLLLRRLEMDPLLHGSDGRPQITHIIVDEVHERSVDSDFLLIILKGLIKKRRA